MDFYCAIKTNDKFGWFTLVFSAALLSIGLLFLKMSFTDADLIGRLFFLLLNSIFLLVFLSILFHIIFPQKIELVVDKNHIRWGNSKKPEKHKKIILNDILYICFNCGIDADATYAFMKDMKQIRLPDEIIGRKSYDKKLKIYLKNNLTGIIVKD